MTSCKYWALDNRDPHEDAPSLDAPGAWPVTFTAIEQRLIEYPLRRVVQQGQERLLHHRPFEPEVNARDRRMSSNAAIPRAMLPAPLSSFGSKSEQNAVRHGHDARIRRHFRPVFQHGLCKAAALQPNFANAASQPHFPAPLQSPSFAAPSYSSASGTRGNAHAVSLAAAEKRLPENFDSVARIRPRKLFVQRAHQHHAPEALDGSRASASSAAANRASRRRRLPADARPLWQSRAAPGRCTACPQPSARRKTGTTAPCAAAAEATNSPSSNAGRPHPRNTAGRRSEFFPTRPRAGKNRPDSCSSRA